MGNRKTQRISITMDTRLVIACDKYLAKVQEVGVNGMTTKSQLIEQALLLYFDQLAKLNLEKGEEESES